MEQIVGDFLKTSLRFETFKLTSSSGEGCPTIGVEGVVFNGKGRFGCESLNFPRKTDIPSEFCKTNNLNYDLAVTVFLAIAKKHLKTRMHVQTDGDQDDWQEAFNVCSRMLGYEYKKFDITDNGKLRYRFWE
jgi:hypothetical protein